MASEIAALLSSLAPWYPGGIPRIELQKQPSPAPFPAGPRLQFIIASDAGGRQAFLETAEGTLLSAAITKGMKLSLDKVEFMPAAGPDELNAFRAASVVMILGEEAARRAARFLATRGLTEASRGWSKSPEGSVCITSDLGAVAADPAEKRKFWSDLQLALQHLAS